MKSAALEYFNDILHVRSSSVSSATVSVARCKLLAQYGVVKVIDTAKAELDERNGGGELENAATGSAALELPPTTELTTMALGHRKSYRMSQRKVVEGSVGEPVVWVQPPTLRGLGAGSAR
ncbi:hypothetical protein B0A55_12772 [Friedmanniomyces simplex]|uniref:Uncharacterized protein n=1 Tax=Friedmanniomyces simplex TaxID=329884 RepID=A0A4U0WFF9_9PEZI|nr:hypothetical protein B0A55_12772 [Friedmanniomyces simplex]